MFSVTTHEDVNDRDSPIAGNFLRTHPLRFDELLRNETLGCVLEYRVDEHRLLRQCTRGDARDLRLPGELDELLLAGIRPVNPSSLA